MIKLYGNLKKKFGDSIDCNVHSITELMKAAEANRPGFRDAIEKDTKYVIRRGDTFKKALDVTEEEIEMNFNDNVWHVLPLPVGYSGVFKFIIGAVLTIVGVYFGQAWLVNIGVGLMLSGVASMLAPAPPQPGDYSGREDPDKKPSYLFNGPLNRTESGGAVPLVYGKDVFIGSIFTSGGLQIGDIA